MKQNYPYIKELFADWMAGKISDDELQKRISKEEFQHFLKLKKSLDLLSEIEKPLDNVYENLKNTIAEVSSKDLQIHSKKRNPKLMRWLMPVAAMLLLFFGLKMFHRNSKVIIETANATQQQITLPDGSQVVVGAQSKLSYDKKQWQKQRTLQLDGEAYFKVTKGSTFSVQTVNGTVSVLGTQFEVKSREQYFKVACFEGKVKVESPKINTVLTPGKVVVATPGEILNIQTKAPEPDWMFGESHFEKTALKYVINELEVQYGIYVDTRQIDLQQKYTGGFTHNNLSLALASVFKPLGIAYQIKKDTVVLYKAK